MRPYEFSFKSGEGRTSEAYLLIDLDKLAAVGKPFFDSYDGIVYFDLNFGGSMGNVSIRALTGFKTRGYDARGQLMRDEAFMLAECDRFTTEVENLKAAWLAPALPQKELP